MMDRMLTLLLTAVIAAQDAPPLERVARVLSAPNARQAGIGLRPVDAIGVDLEGAPRSWTIALGEAGGVVALTSLTCPLCQRLAPELARLEERARAAGFGFIHVAATGLDSVADLEAHAARFGLASEVLCDTTGAIAAAFDARTTTEVFVLDRKGTLCYRGAVNDQYGLGSALDAPQNRFLEDALRALLRGEAVEVSATTAPGCLLERTPEAAAGERAPLDDGANNAGAIGPASFGPASFGPVDYARDIARLMQRSCVECHREGGIAPFALDSYDDVARRANMLAAVMDDGSMPPWFARAPAHGASPWANDRSLGANDRARFAAWIAQGKPRGDEAFLPLPRAFGRSDGWQLGTPDAIYTLPRPFRVPAEGTVDYQYFTVPTGLTEDRWVTALEVRPGARSVVHHVLVYALPKEAFKNGRLERWDLVDERRGFFAAWAPGSEPVVYPAGHARELAAGTGLLFELHYTPNGRAAVDQSSIGVHFAPAGPEGRPSHVVRTAGISNRGLRIPAGVAAHVERSTGVAARELRLTAFMPHMHLRGKSFTFDLVEVNGARQTLLDVPRYDFNWQLRYVLAEPLTMQRGARLDIAGVFDNSAGNPANPAPERTIGWGPETADEMLIGFVDYVLVEEDHSLRADDPQFVVLEPRVQAQLRALAAQNDGVLRRAALPRGARESFDKLDFDGDGALDAAELSLLARRDAGERD